jgi:hypothetical protein
MGWLKKSYGDLINRNLSPETKKEIAALYEMGLECKTVYPMGAPSEDIAIPVTDIEKIAGIAEATAKILIKADVLTSQDATLLGVDGLVAINGIGNKTADGILSAINGLVVSSGDDKRLLISFGYPKGCYTPDTEFEGVVKRSKAGDVLTDTRMFHTELANAPHTTDDATAPDAECYINYRTVEDWPLYMKHCQSFNVTRNNKTRKIIAACGIKDLRATVTDFVEWAGWKKGSLEGELMPDTTPKNLAGDKARELEVMKAKLKTGQRDAG